MTKLIPRRNPLDKRITICLDIETYEKLLRLKASFNIPEAIRRAVEDLVNGIPIDQAEKRES